MALYGVTDAMLDHPGVQGSKHLIDSEISKKLSVSMSRKRAPAA